MSKRLKNYPDPIYMIENYGADALRLYLVYSPVVRAEDLCFSEEGVKQLMRHILIPLWNAYSFFVTYANIDGWSGEQLTGGSSENVLDRWIRSSLTTLEERVRTAMDEYDLQRAVRPFVAFIEDLTNWYIRRSRRRFWKSQNDEDKRQAYETLYTVLLELSKIAAPFIPFISESIYRNLRTADMPESVHLCDFPVSDGSDRDTELEEQMAEVMTMVRLGRLLRSEHDLKVRQPLEAIHVVSQDPQVLQRIRSMEDIVLDELNVRRLVTGSQETELAELKSKADFRRLGPRLGAGMKRAAAAIAAMPSDQVEALAKGEAVVLGVGDQDLELAPEDVVIERLPKAGLVVASEGTIVVALETELTEELVLEGLAREFVNKVQNMRKAADLEVTQRIRVAFESSGEVEKAVAANRDYILAEILAVECEPAPNLDDDATAWDLNGHPCRIRVTPVDPSE